MKRSLIIFSIALLPLFLFNACEKENSGKGTMNLSITDAPIDSDGITGVFITVTEVQYHTSGNNWSVLGEFESSNTFNLLELTRGESEMLGSFDLNAGTYTQLRFILDAPVYGSGQHANPGCFLEFEDGSTQPLFVPSGSQTGFKAVGAFHVPENGTVDLTADFDVRKSVIKAGTSGKYILKPTIRLVVDNQAGKICGDVLNILNSTDIIVYAYAEGTYNSSEADDPESEEDVRFPNAITSDRADENGDYCLAYLAPGSYDLVITASVNGEFDVVLGILESITVESKLTTSLQIDISLL